MRLTVCLESDTEGRVLASVDMEEILKQCKENSISKEAFEKMKSKAHNHGYRQGYAKALNDFVQKVKEHQYVLSDVINSKDYGMFTVGIEQIAEELKEEDK